MIPSGDDDPFLWLEEIDGQEALDWVKRQNGRTEQTLTDDDRFRKFEAEALAIYEAKDKIPYGRLYGSHFYNFWQDGDHIRGLYRRMPFAEYQESGGAWEVLLDLDRLAEQEGENWVLKGIRHQLPDGDRCLLSLSRGGGDAVVIREFDLNNRSFPDGGFVIPEGKNSAEWVSRDALLVAADLGPESLTDSGYPAEARLWKRGESLADSPVLMKIGTDEMVLSPFVQVRPEGQYSLLVRQMSFRTARYYPLKGESLSEPLPLPEDAAFHGFFHNRVLLILRTDGDLGKQGDVVFVDPETGGSRLVYRPDSGASAQYIDQTSTKLLLGTLENVVNRLKLVEPDSCGKTFSVVELPVPGDTELQFSDPFSERFLFTVRDFLTPTTLYHCDGLPDDCRALRSLPARFQVKNLEIRQRFAESADGTRIPYFLVGPAGGPRNGGSPVLLYGYGGFEISLTQGYEPVVGKLWLENGGYYAVANIRGGGEFGPSWHQAALRENRPRAFEDFIAVAEDLIATGFTTPRKLGIMGGSNGGLLVGAVMTRRPDLAGAVVCEVPLLDMLRYHKLLAGASWMEEYGDPDNRDDRRYLSTWSPYHRLEKGVNYPPILFYTSTRDDRVHPGHARKMAARLEALGQTFLYYENTEGGHSAGANLKQYARMAALEYGFLARSLMNSEEVSLRRE